MRKGDDPLRWGVCVQLYLAGSAVQFLSREEGTSLILSLSQSMRFKDS